MRPSGSSDIFETLRKIGEWICDKRLHSSYAKLHELAKPMWDKICAVDLGLADLK